MVGPEGERQPEKIRSTKIMAFKDNISMVPEKMINVYCFG